MKAFKFFRRKADWLEVDKQNTKIEYEFTIPSIVSDEFGLKKIADKNNLKLLYKIREGSERPVTRILRATENFQDIPTSDKQVSKLVKILNTANIESTFRSSLIVPYFPPDPYFYDGMLTDKVVVSATFQRRPNQDITELDFDPEWINYYYYTIFLTRDSELAENEWRIHLSYAVHRNTRSFIELDTKKFESWAKNRLNANNFEKRIILDL